MKCQNVAFVSFFAQGIQSNTFFVSYNSFVLLLSKLCDVLYSTEDAKSIVERWLRIALRCMFVLYVSDPMVKLILVFNRVAVMFAF